MALVNYYLCNNIYEVVNIVHFWHVFVCLYVCNGGGGVGDGGEGLILRETKYFRFISVNIIIDFFQR